MFRVKHRDVIAISILSPFSALITTLTNASQLSLQYNAALLALVLIPLLRKVAHPFLALIAVLSFLAVSLVLLYTTLSGDHRFNYSLSATILFVAVLLLYSKENESNESKGDLISITASTILALTLIAASLLIADKVGVKTFDQASTEISVKVKENNSNVTFIVEVSNAPEKRYLISTSNGIASGRIKKNGNLRTVIKTNCSSPVTIKVGDQVLQRKPLCPLTKEF
ncbi:MAG: hypothetical protein ACKOW9_00810 [Candidatus Paceibacterota bacterium]